MIVSVFVRRLKEGCTFEEFIAEWEADKGFGVPTRVFNSVSLEDPREVLTVGFVAVSGEGLAEALNDPRIVEIGSAHSLLIGLAQAGDARI